MIDLKNFALLIDQIAEDKGISRDQVVETIEQALAAAYKREYGQRSQVVKAKLDLASGKTVFSQVKLVVDEGMIYSEEELEAMKEQRESGQEVPVAEEEDKRVRFNPERHIMLEDAKKIKQDVQLEEELELPLPSEDEYGRIAAQTAKQVILQKIREAERTTTMTEYKSKEGELVSGIVQRVEGRAVFCELGKAVGVMPREEQVPGEFYRTGQRLKFYVLRVEDIGRGPTILLSRAYPKFISKLFELEVPELQTGTVVIKTIAREPGFRSKIAVASSMEGVDPIGSMVGQRGTRVAAVISELGGEKIDVVEWADDPGVLIANALAPAQILNVELEDKNMATAIVPADQLSLAIGREGQNVRLAAKLTGWKIDIRTPEGEVAKGEEVEKEKQEEEAFKESVEQSGQPEEEKTEA